MGALLGGRAAALPRRVAQPLRRAEDAQAWTSSDAAALAERARAPAALKGVRGALAITPLPRDLPAICRPSTLMLTRAGPGEGAAGTRFVCVRDVCVVPTAWWWLD